MPDLGASLWLLCWGSGLAMVPENNRSSSSLLQLSPGCLEQVSVGSQVSGLQALLWQSPAAGRCSSGFEQTAISLLKHRNKRRCVNFPSELPVTFSLVKLAPP